MLGLPKDTEISRPLPKKAIFDKFKPSAAERRRFDADIKSLSLVNEVSAATCALAAGETVKSFYVVLVNLRSAKCDKKNLALLARLIEQHMLFILEYAGQARLAVFRAGKDLESETKPLSDQEISLAGLNLDAAWDNIIASIGGVTVAEGETLDERIAEDDRRAKMLRRVEQLEKKARAEKQPRRKWELAEEAKRLKI